MAHFWRTRLYEQVRPFVVATHQYQEHTRPKETGRPKATVVTGYLLLDDSTHPKPKGRKIGGLGKHWSSTQKRQVTGHSLFQAFYVLEGRQCPLPPKMYRTKAVCDKEEKPSKAKSIGGAMRYRVRNGRTDTHVLEDS